MRSINNNLIGIKPKIKDEEDLKMSEYAAYQKAMENITKEEQNKMRENALNPSLMDLAVNDAKKKSALKDAFSVASGVVKNNIPQNIGVVSPSSIIVPNTDGVREGLGKVANTYQQAAAEARANAGETEATQNDTQNVTQNSTSPVVYNALSYLEGQTGNTNDDISNMINDYLNRDKFSYDPNSDAMYQNYLTAMQNAGQMAMRDTLGQASMLTGGYGSSYANSVAQGAYNDYIQRANEALPDYYNLALDQYNEEGNDALNRIKLQQGEYEEVGKTDTMTDTQKTSILRDAAKAWDEGEEKFKAYMDSLNPYNISDEFLSEISNYINNHGNYTITKTDNKLGYKNDSFEDQQGNAYSYDELHKFVEAGLITEDEFKKIIKGNKGTVNNITR